MLEITTQLLVQLSLWVTHCPEALKFERACGRQLLVSAAMVGGAYVLVRCQMWFTSWHKTLGMRERDVIWEQFCLKKVNLEAVIYLAADKWCCV